MDTDTITGMFYATHANERLSTSKALTFISASSYPFCGLGLKAQAGPGTLAE